MAVYPLVINAKDPSNATSDLRLWIGQSPSDLRQDTRFPLIRDETGDPKCFSYHVGVAFNDKLLKWLPYLAHGDSIQVFQFLPDGFKPFCLGFLIYTCEGNQRQWWAGHDPYRFPFNSIDDIVKRNWSA